MQITAERSGTLAVPIGVDAIGRNLMVPLEENSTLVAGLPGTGKSNTLRAVLVGASQRPEVALIGIDAKRVELRRWRERLSHLAVDLDEITTLLRALVVEMDARYAQLEQRDATRWVCTPSSPALVVVVDELAEIVASGEPGDNERGLLLRRLLAKGRAAGICLVVATQRPSADIVPTSVRDLIGLRICHAVPNRETVEMVLGGAWRSAPAHELPIGPRFAGLAYASLEGDRVAVKCRSWYVDDEMVRRVTTSTAHLRPEVALVGMGGANAPSAARVNPERSEPVGARVDADGAGANIPPAGQDDESLVLAALHTAGRPLRFGELVEAVPISEGRTRAALAGLTTVSRVLRLPNNAYRLVLA